MASEGTGGGSPSPRHGAGGEGKASTSSSTSGARQRHIQLHSVSVGRDKNIRRVSNVSAPRLKIPPNLDQQDSLLEIPLGTPTQSQRHMRSFLAQKCFRTRKSTSTRRFFLWLVTLGALVGAWAIGYLQYSFGALLVLLVVMVVVWWDQSGRVLHDVEQETEIRVKRQKTMKNSETAEWVNFAINRWWMTCSDSVLDILRDYIQPLLQDMAPRGVDLVELVECDFATQTPFLKNIQLFDPPSQDPQRGPSEYLTGPQSSDSTNMVVNLDLGIVAPDSKIVLKARLGGKRFGYDTLVYVEGLHLTGSLQAMVTIDNEAPFPHIACITATFPRKPDLWFSVRVLKGLKVTEIPLLKSWIHTFIMDIFTTLLVDPGKLSLNFQEGGPLPYNPVEPLGRAQGVVTVTIRGSSPQKKSQYASDPRRWCTVRIGQQKHKLHIPVAKTNWEATFSFLVYNLQQDALVLKVKHHRVMRSLTLAVHSVSLSSLDLDNDRGKGESGKNAVFLSNEEANIALDLEYADLPSFSLHTPTLTQPITLVSGVLYVHVHSGTDLLSADADGLSDPYCMVLINKRKVLTTHYILDTLRPTWERGVEVFVADFTQVSLTFVVYDWDGPLVGDDLLGVAKLNLQQDKPELLQKKLELEIDGSNQSGRGQLLGYITVSTVFRPCASVARGDLGAMATATPSQECHQRGRRGTKEQIRKVARLLKVRRQGLPYESSAVIELTVVQGRNLVPKDLNGLSDPYLVVRYAQDTVFKTRVIKKTLDPEWNESATLSAPHSDDLIKVECWDKDRFSDDFMGSLQFSDSDLEKFSDGPKWCRLDHVATGEILLGLKKIVPSGLSDWSHLDEASRQLLSAQNGEMLGEERSVDSASQGSVNGERPSILVDSDSEGERCTQHSNSRADSSVTTSTSGVSSVGNGGTQLESDMSLLSPTPPPSMLKRRHTVTVHHPHSPAITGSRKTTPPSLTITSSDDMASSPLSDQPIRYSSSQSDQPIRYSSTQSDIRRALRTGSGHERRTVPERLPRQRSPALFYNVYGQVIEADGIKGHLDQLELYIKVRLNTRPSYQRQHKFSRGPVVHKTRPLRGTTNPQWREDFLVRESPIPSDSLFTVDIKSGSKVNIGTHAIPLDKFFDSSVKTTRWLDIGNDMRLRVRLAHQPPSASSLSSPVESSRRHQL